MDPTHITLGERDIPLTVKRHQGARRISLRLTPGRDGIILTLPRHGALATGLRFVTSKADWVLAHVAPDTGAPFAPDSAITLLGVPYRIRHLGGRGVTELAGDELRVHGGAAFTARRVRDFLKKHLREECLLRAKRAARMLGKTVADVKIREMSSRWGSCTAKGALAFSRHLIFAPPEILDYLVAHEVAHLQEMNHGPRFWAVVRELCPDYEAARRWLRRHGHELHRYG